MAIKDLAELIKKFTQKDKFKPTTVQVIKSAKNPPVPAQNEDISVPSEGERIHFLNTGRSDCILLQSGDRFALVDCGDAEHAKHTARYLKETAGGKINLDFIAITHLHSGHVGGLGTLLDDKDIAIGKYISSRLSARTSRSGTSVSTTATRCINRSAKRRRA